MIWNLATNPTATSTRARGNAEQRARDLDVIDGLISAAERVLLARTTRSAELAREAADSLAGSVASNWQAARPRPIWIQRGHGSHVVDVDGTDYVDLHAGFGAALVGHAHPAIVRAITERVAQGTHFAQPTEGLIPVTRNLAARFGLPLWRFTNSGTESTLAAVHLMRAFTRRQRIIKVEGSYHGHHDAVQVSVDPRRVDMGPSERPHSIPAGTFLSRAFAQSTLVVPFGDLEALARTLDVHGHEVAGMIVEPVMMGIGIVPPPPGYLDAARELLHAHGALITYDEVKTGFAVGPGGVTGATALKPDLVCLAKALGGGVACGAIGGTREVMDLIVRGTYEQVGTFNGNPLALAAMRATLEEVLTPAAYAHLDGLRRLLVEGCEDVLRRYAIAGHVVAMGAKGCVVFADEPIRNYREFLEYDDRWGHAHWLYQHNGGVFLPPWGKCEQWTIGVQHTADDAQRFVANLERFARALREAG